MAMTQTPNNPGLRLGRAPKAYVGEQDKTRPPAQTVAWARERLAALGQDVLRQTKRIDTGRLGVPVFISLCGDAATMLTGTKKQMGKGASPEQAEASALMELAERFSFFHFMASADLPWATAGQLEGGPVMDFAQAAKAVGHPAHDLARARAVYELLPQQWAWAHNLAAGRDELLPLSWFYAINEYNGPAAGNCLEEAVLQSLCEVIERHVCALVSQHRLATPAIDPASIVDPISLELLAKFKNAGVEVFLKDFTRDMGAPTVAALCYDPATFPHDSEIVYAAGTAPDPEKALIRALTEVAQLAGDFHTGSSYKVSALPKFASLEEAAYVTQAAGTVALGQLPDLRRDDLGAEVAACVAALDQRGYTVYSLDVTHQALQVPAVYTIVPGAHFAQRTFDVDVYFHAAKLAAQLPDAAQALDVLEQMAAIAGHSHATHFFRAVALLELGLAGEALNALDTALGLNPPPRDEASMHTQRGVAFKDLERYDLALEALTKAASFPEPHHEVFNLMGFCLFKQKRHMEAIAAFERAIEIEPGAAINYANIGANMRELGKLEEACRMYEHALELDPGLDFARQSLERLRAMLA